MTHFDEIYAGTPHFFGEEPSVLLSRWHDLIPRPGRALDIGVGQGRNAIFLARGGIEIVALDTSSVGIEAVRRLAAEESLPIELHESDIMAFSPEDTESGASYDAVLALGIIPLLPRRDVDTLFPRIDEWVRPGGLVFVSAYCTRDVRFRECAEEAEWEPVDQNTFTRGDRTRTFLEPTEILTLLPGYSTVDHHEGLTPEHRHGDGPPDRHFLARLVARKPIPRK